MAFWGRKTFCVIAGASRGIGQAIAVNFARKVAPGSVFLLLARSTAALEKTRDEILADPENKCGAVIATTIDLSAPDPAEFRNIIDGGFIKSGTKREDFSNSILVQCAASLGIEKGYNAAQIQDLSYIKNYFDFNITSFILLNSTFCEAVGATSGNKSSQRVTLVHISSMGALMPFKSWGLYCAARAAKNMLLRSIALESPNVHTISYAPGTVDTENFTEAIKYTADAELVKFFQQEKDQGRLLTPQQTVLKLMDILESGQFVKGEHVSYSD